MRAAAIPGRSRPGDRLQRQFGRGVRNESGYVLGVVLAAMTVGLLLITALLSLSFATHRAATVQQRLAAEQRAVDGALETSLTRVRASYNTSGQFDPCAPFAGDIPELDEIAFDSGTDDLGDDSTARVDCGEVLGNGSEANGTVRLVGEDYSEVPGGENWTGWDWAAALDGSVAAPDGAVAPTLVHNADEPLRFNGSVAVRSGTAALLNETGAAGALDIRGSYLQGAAGYPGTGSQCGMLSSAFTDGDASRTAVIDNDATPACGDSAAATMDETVVVDGPTRAEPTVPVPTSCPGGTFTFDPGDYNSTRTAALNSLFSQDCSTLYYFEPGVYWFDVGGPDNALVFDDATSAFVFGTVKGSGSTATCDPTAASGAKVILSARSTIEHLAGNVSICADSGEGAALVQSQVQPSDILLANPVSGTHCVSIICFGSGKRADFTPVADVLELASSTAGAVAKVDCFPWNTPCSLRFSVDMATASDQVMDHVEVLWTSSESPNAHFSNRTVSVQIALADGSSCTVPHQPAGRTTGFMTAVDLTAGCSALVGAPQSVLDGATMTLVFRYPDFIGGEQIKLNLRGLDMRVNAHEVNATQASSESTPAVPAPAVAWPGADPAVLSGDGTGTTYADPGPCGELLDPDWICNRASAESVTLQPLTVGQFDVEAAGLDPEVDTISSLSLAIDNVGGDNQISAPSGGGVRGETWVELTWTGGSCAVERQTINTYTRSERTYYIDILGSEDSDCGVLAGQPMSVLEGASVRLSMRPERGMWIGGSPRYSSGLALPKLDHVRLTASSDVTDTFRRARVTTDVGNNTRFRVHGDVIVPHMSLDVRWDGTVDTDPIVDGSLQAHSLGSTAADGAAVGLVCCGTGAREVQIVAELADEGGNWVPRGMARAVLAKDPAEPLAAATVTGWQFCKGAGCSLGSGGGLGPPP